MPRTSWSIASSAAPASGRIGRKTVESGNRINVGAALMAVVETYGRGQFQGDAAREDAPRPGGEDAIDAIPDHKFRGVVTVGRRAPGSTFALLPPDNATGNFTKIVQRVPVKIRFDMDSVKGTRPDLFPGFRASRASC